MAKNQTTAGANGKSVNRDRSQTGGSSLSSRFVDKRTASRSKGTRREILFPTEPTSIPHEQLDRAIDAVMARKK